MSQHPMTIANQAGASFRADLNNMALAIASLNSGATAPSTTYAYMWWPDTTAGLLKQRNAANSGWITVCSLANWALTSVQTQAATAFASTGTAPAYVVTAAPAVGLVADTRLQITWHASTSGACTLAANGTAATAIKQYDSTGAKVDPVIVSGVKSDVVYDGTHWVILDPLPASVSIPPGTIIDFAGTTAPTGYLACPTSATNISRTTYAALFAAIGATWGAGDGSTTFGMPWFPSDYASVQANGNVGTQTVGVVINHVHSNTSAAVNTSTTPGGAVTTAAQTTANTGNPTAGGSANLPAGVRILKCVKH